MAGLGYSGTTEACFFPDFYVQPHRIAFFYGLCGPLSLTISSEPDPIRRQLIFGTLGAAGMMAYTVWHDKVGLGFGLKDLVSKSTRTVVARALQLPRYLPIAQRPRNHVIGKIPGQQSTFLSRNRKDWEDRPERAILHYADAEGEIRFFSAAPAIKNLKPLPDAQAASAAWLQDQLVEPVRTWQWEAAALDRIEAGRIEDACELLLAQSEARPRCSCAPPEI